MLRTECINIYVLCFYYHCPASIYTLFTKLSHYHSTKLHESIFYVPDIRTSAFRNSTAINGIFLWNNLPESVKSIIYLNLLKAYYLIIFVSKLYYLNYY